MRCSWVLAFAVATTAVAEVPDGEWRVAQKRAAAAVQAKNAGELITALEVAGKDDSKRAVDLVLQVGPLAPDAKSYDAAVKALAAMTSEKATATLLERLSGKKTPIEQRILACDAIAIREDDASAAGLVDALSAKEPGLVRVAIAGLKKRRPRAAIEPLIALYGQLLKGKEADGQLAGNVREALWDLTGESFENEPDWRKWWEASKAEFRVKTGNQGPPPPGTAARDKKRPTFFGTELRSDRLVFVIDISGSMSEDDRIGRAKTQLETAIKALGQGAAFTVVAYSSGCRMWEKTLVPANEPNKQRALEFVRGLQPVGNTLTLGAAKAAFEIEGADTIVLLSDGAPTEMSGNTPMPIDEVASQIVALNRFKRWRIDTFGFQIDGAKELAEFMKRIAHETGGVYTEIPK